MEKRGTKLKLIFAILILILLISKIDFEKINRKILNRLDNLISKIEKILDINQKMWYNVHTRSKDLKK